MFFGELLTNDTLGCYLAHARDTKKGRIRKGQLLSEGHLRQLQIEGVTSLIVARMGRDDVHEDRAAEMVAEAVTGSVIAGEVSNGVVFKSGNTGRVNLHASQAGLWELNRSCILNVNRTDSAITLATLPENTWVDAGQIVATIKIIPYGVGSTALSEVAKIGFQTRCSGALPVRVNAAIPQAAHLVQTVLPHSRQSILDKTARVTEQRLSKRSCQLVSENVVPHDCDALVSLLISLTSNTTVYPDSWILIVGASAISDSSDIIPAALEAAGGRVANYGMPVEPGNLILIGCLDKHPVVGLPGCARSASYNGFDFVLDRLACQRPINDEWITGLSIGGLL